MVNINETSCRLLRMHQIGWVPSRRQTSSAAGQHEGGHDIHGRCQHGSWSAGHAGADRARGQDRRRLAGAALAGAHSSRHVRDRLGQHDDAPAAHGHFGQRAEPEQRRTSVNPSLGHGQHPRQRRHLGRHAATFPHVVPATKHVVLAALRRVRLPQFQELHPDAGERPLRPRWHLRRLGHEQGMATTVFGRTSAARTRLGLLVGVFRAPTAMPTSKKPWQRPRHSTPTMSSSPSTSSQSPLPKTPWNGPWQRRQTTKTPRWCQAHHSSHAASSGVCTSDVQHGTGLVYGAGPR